MDLAVFSPKKQQGLHQYSTRHSASKRSLFPSHSPQSNDLGQICELSSDNSTTYSPYKISPSRSISPEKHNSRSFNKENFKAKFDTTLLCSSEDELFLSQNTIESNNVTTPKKTTEVNYRKKFIRSPHFVHKSDVTIKPNSFYGNTIMPLMPKNQNNRFQGTKHVRPVHPSRAKVKLLFDEKPAKKRERSKSHDIFRDAKKRKTLFTGVQHAIPKPSKPKSPTMSAQQESVRAKALKVTDLSRTPYRKKSPDCWDYTLRFTKPPRYNEDIGTKRKFFKSSLKESPSSTIRSPVIQKRRKLLDTRKSYLAETASPRNQELTVTDLLPLVDDFYSEQLQSSKEVDDIVLRLEYDMRDEKERETEKLIQILQDSPNKISAIDSLSNDTANMDLNDLTSVFLKTNSENSTDQDGASAKQLFPIFKSCSNNMPASESTCKTKWLGVGKDQLQIDAGQKKFGAHQCHECGMIYQRGEAEDETQHKVFHNDLNTLRYNNWKKENVVGYFGFEYAIVVTQDDPKSWQQKALDVLIVIDKSLGVTSDSPTIKRNEKVFLYISEKRIVGCMVACPITKAYKLLDSESDVNFCSEESLPARCGISRMWTRYSHRRRGIATRLLDTVRSNFLYGNILPKEAIAFSIPTPEGKNFAASYMASTNFLVYTDYY